MGSDVDGFVVDWAAGPASAYVVALDQGKWDGIEAAAVETSGVALGFALEVG